jgi:hypothetical protein
MKNNSVIMSLALAKYRRIEPTFSVILSSPLGEYRRMKPTTALRYETPFLLSVTGRLLPFGNAQGKLMNSFVRNLAITMLYFTEPINKEKP